MTAAPWVCIAIPRQGTSILPENSDVSFPIDTLKCHDCPVENPWDGVDEHADAAGTGAGESRRGAGPRYQDTDLRKQEPSGQQRGRRGVLLAHRQPRGPGPGAQRPGADRKAGRCHAQRGPGQGHAARGQRPARRRLHRRPAAHAAGRTGTGAARAAPGNPAVRVRRAPGRRRPEQSERTVQRLRHLPAGTGPQQAGQRHRTDGQLAISCARGTELEQPGGGGFLHRQPRPAGSAVGEGSGHRLGDGGRPHRHPAGPRDGCLQARQRFQQRQPGAERHHRRLRTCTGHHRQRRPQHRHLLRCRPAGFAAHGDRHGAAGAAFGCRRDPGLSPDGRRCPANGGQPLRQHQQQFRALSRRRRVQDRARHPRERRGYFGGYAAGPAGGGRPP